MERWIGRVALVTGANSGIGASVTKLLLQSGMKVVGADINTNSLENFGNILNVKEGSFMSVKCDLRKDEDVYALFNVINESYGGVDICINNAGVIYNKNILDGTPDEWRHMVDVNVIALCLCTKLSVASMKSRNVDDGHIINLCSIRGHAVYPNSHFYTSTKFAVRAITEGLRQELRDEKSHIRVSAISPGKVKTEILKNSSKDNDIREKIEDRSRGSHLLQADDIASLILHIIKSPPNVEINDIIVRPTDRK